MTNALIVVLLTIAVGLLAGLGFASRSSGTERGEATPVEPLRIGVVGLSHGHVEGLLWNGNERDDIILTGIYEPDRALFDTMAEKYALDPSLYYDSLDAMLDETTPEAVSVMTPIADHVAAVEACAPRGVHLLIEKPLAFSNDDAERIAELAEAHDVLVLTNYETSWYSSVREAKRLVNDDGFAPIRRMAFRHGHKGPIEIGCAPEFTDWLCDPEQNGGGAIVDFGCYGAILATWYMDGARPTSVTASASTLKPDMYPNVDDDATIVLTYPTATAVVQASWAWTHDNKELDLHTEGGSIHAGKWAELSVRRPDAPPERFEPAPNPPSLTDEWTYLRRVIRGECEVDPLSSLELNLIAVDILDRARQQVQRELRPE